MGYNWNDPESTKNLGNFGENSKVKKNFYFFLCEKNIFLFFLRDSFPRSHLLRIISVAAKSEYALKISEKIPIEKLITHSILLGGISAANLTLEILMELSAKFPAFEVHNFFFLHGKITKKKKKNREKFLKFHWKFYLNLNLFSANLEIPSLFFFDY